MNKLLKLAVYTNLWVALAISCFTWLSVTEVTSIPQEYIFFVFCSTIGAYNYMRIVQMPKELNQDLKQKFWMGKRFLQALFFTSIFLLLAAFFYSQIFSIELFLATAPAFIIAFLYPIGFNHAFKSFSSLRNTPGLKLFLISVSWAYISFLMPTLVFGRLEVSVIYEFVFRIAMVAALVIPFDIRDIPIDGEEMQTLPQKIGASKSKLVACLLMLSYILWKWWEFAFFEASFSLAIAWLISGLIGIWLICRMNSKRSELYCGFWVESIPILTTIILFGLTDLLAKGTF